jgi:hypothetical protein
MLTAKRIVFPGSGDVFDAGSLIVDVLRDGGVHIDLGLGGADTGVGGGRGGGVGRRGGALDDDVEMGGEGRDGTDSGEERGEDHADRRDGEGDLHEGVAVLVLDDDAADVAFMDELADLGSELVSLDLKLLEKMAERVHVGSVTRLRAGAETAVCSR